VSLLPSTEAALQRRVAEVQASTRQPSLVAGVARDGRTAWWAARGTHTGSAPDSGPDPDTQYRIGSITKSVTAITVLQCRDDQLVDLDDPLSAYVAEAPFGATSLRRLLAHGGGLPAEPAGAWWERHDESELGHLFERTAQQPSVLPAGSRAHYSNLGYALLGAVVAAVRGEPWWEVARTRVLEPLGMSRTTFRSQPPHATGFSCTRSAAGCTPSRTATPGRWPRPASCGARSTTWSGCRRSGHRPAARCCAAPAPRRWPRCTPARPPSWSRPTGSA